MQDFIVPYDPQWAHSFQALRKHLEGVLDDLRIDIQHVGSTAIPGLCAKPVLDIDIIIHDANLLPLVSIRLEQAGYKARGDQGIPGRYAFRQQDLSVPWTSTRRTWTAHHLYVCLPDSLALKNHLRFRDALLADPSLADAYGRFKMNLAQIPGMDRENYTRAKTRFILEALSRAGFNAEELRLIEDANR